MEGKIGAAGMRGAVFLGVVALAVPFAATGHAQIAKDRPSAEHGPRLKLRKTIKTREYRGKAVEGEERVVAPGDSLWRILIQEKGLSGKRFGRYQIIIAGLNPQIKDVDILRIGDSLFIPIKPDELLAIQFPDTKSGTRASATKAQVGPKVYRVRQGDYLYKILREQLALEGNREIRKVFEEVKELNPRKSNWDLLLSGELLRLPSPPPAVAQAPSPAPNVPEKPEVMSFNNARKLPARGNLPLLREVLAALGNEMQGSGEEVLALPDGTVRVERSSYPVILNPAREQKVLLDPEGKIPPSVRSGLDREDAPARVVPIGKDTSLHETVNQVLFRLGFQSLPENRPVTLQDGAAAVEVKGDWMVIAPEQKDQAQEILIINLRDGGEGAPEYLKDYLSLKGMNLKDIIVPSASSAPASPVTTMGSKEAETPSVRWPAEKEAMIDAFFKALGIPLLGPQDLSVTLREGIRLDTKSDRAFELNGAKFALFFHPVNPEVKTALREGAGARAMEVNLKSLNTKELITRLLKELGEPAEFREHHFPGGGGTPDKVKLTFSGFLLASRSLFLTDREIPGGLQRFFSDRGLRIIYFQ